MAFQLSHCKPYCTRDVTGDILQARGSQQLNRGKASFDPQMANRWIEPVCSKGRRPPGAVIAPVFAFASIVAFLLVTLPATDLPGSDPDLVAVENIPTEALRAYDAAYRDTATKSDELKTVATGRPCPLRHNPDWGGVQSSFDDKTQTLHSPPDSIQVCEVIAGAVAAGLLPAAAAVRHGLTMLDVGAAFSGESIMGHKMGFHVVAFEARETEYKQIVAATQRFRKIEVINAAVADISGPVSFFMAIDSSSLLKSAVEGEREAPKAQSERKQKVTVQGVTLDEVAAERGIKIGFMKVDVQGAEYNVLRGAIHILRRDKPVVNFEYTPYLVDGGSWLESSPILRESPRVLALMERLGYECMPCAADPNMAACSFK